MSRIGNAIITIPTGVTLTQGDGVAVVKGPKGELSLPLPGRLTITADGPTITITRAHNDKATKSLHGYFRAVLSNAIEGVTNGWTQTLELSGVGYRASMSGSNVVLSVGFSHQVTVTPPAGVAFAVVDNKIKVSGIDRQVVGQTAAKIRSVKKPEPYKGKGIKYEGERIRKKAGKAKAVGGAPGAK